MHIMTRDVIANSYKEEIEKFVNKIKENS